MYYLRFILVDQVVRSIPRVAKKQHCKHFEVASRKEAEISDRSQLRLGFAVRTIDANFR